MKTIILAAALALTSISVNADNSTSSKKVTIGATNSFKREFGDVSDVSWSAADNHMFRASFTQDDQKVHAFFNQNGELVATTTELSAQELPAKLRAAISKKETDGIITEALQLQGDDELSYYVKVYVNGVDKLYKGSSLGALQQVKY